VDVLEGVAAKCRDLAKRKEVRVEAARCDVSKAEDVGALAQLVRASFRRCDVVIANAAYPGPVVLKMHEGETPWVDKAFEVNALGTYYVAHHFVPLLLESEGGAKLFLAIGSIAGSIRKGIIANMGYCVSKMAQTRIIEYVAEQYGNEGLTSICLHPGAVMTPEAKSNTPEQFMSYLTDAIDLCGSVCVWVTEKVIQRELGWMNGRLMSATWDMDELLDRRKEVEDGDLLKFAMLA
jgi:NAD(P)-dependent dehydrogenase (short-subunit alcohol dehydrogenase family)